MGGWDYSYFNSFLTRDSVPLAFCGSSTVLLLSASFSGDMAAGQVTHWIQRQFTGTTKFVFLFNLVAKSTTLEILSRFSQFARTALWEKRGKFKLS